MTNRTIKVTGPRAQGTVVSASLLRDLLEVVIEGSRKAVRIRTEGRSTARGTPPRWIDASADFTVEIRSGSTELLLGTPTLLEVNPQEFGQGNLFPEIDPENTSFDYLAESLAAAVHGESSTLFDRSLLHTFQKLKNVFNSGAQSIQFINGETLRVKPEHLERFSILEANIPPSRSVRLSGKLDLIRHSDHTFTLVLPDSGATIRGVAESVNQQSLQSLWGKYVVISGTAHFAAGGQLLRLDADTVDLAFERDLLLWAQMPEPLAKGPAMPDYRRSQGPRSGINAIWGRWPGDEPDEIILRELEEVS
jgi:hypothetical protein